MRVLHDEILRLLSDRIEARVGAAELDVESVSNEFSDSIVESLDAVSYEIHDAIVADGLGWLSDYRSLNEGFVERNAERWGTAFDHLDLLIHAARECGELLNDRVRKEDREDATAAFDATTRLHARACVIAQEISCLLQAGFPDGAHARWRALHEVVVVAMFLADRGDEAVRRFYDYQVVEAYKGASKHKEYEHRLNEEPLTEGEILELKRQYDRVIKRYGKDFDSPYGWARPFIKGPCHLAALEEAVHLDHMRPYYKMASQWIHATPKSLVFSLGTSEAEQDLLLAGPSNSGMADPGHSTAISLVQITCCLLTMSVTYDGLVLMRVLTRLTDEVGQKFIECG